LTDTSLSHLPVASSTRQMLDLSPS
jgi:hypothetical protein